MKNNILSLLLQLILLLANFMLIQGNIDPEFQTLLVDEFRSLVADELKKDFMKSDGYLLRWLDFYDFDVEHTVSQFKKFIEWRKQQNIDMILTEDFSSLNMDYPFTIEGHDNDGRPIAWALTGSYDIRKIMLAGAAQLFQRYWVRVYELVEHHLHEIRQRNGNNENITQIIAIFDMTGFNLKTSACLQCLTIIPEYVSNVENYYPNIFKRIYNINSPSWQEKTSRIVRNFLSKKSKDTWEVYDFDKNKWSQVLLKNIPSDQIPIEYGGTKEHFFETSSWLSSNPNHPIIRKILEEASLEPNEIIIGKNMESGHPHKNSTHGSEGASSNLIPSSELVKQNHQHHHHHYTNKQEVDAVIKYKSMKQSARSSSNNLVCKKQIIIFANFLTAYFVFVKQ